MSKIQNELTELTYGELELQHDGTTISALAIAIIKKMQEYGRDQYLYPELLPELIRMLYKLKKQYIGSHPQDKQDDLLTDAFVYVFCTNGRKNIKSYVGYNPNTGNGLSLPQYYAQLLRNALINASKLQKKYHTYESNPNIDSYTQEDTPPTLEDIMDIDLHNHKSHAPAHRPDQEYIETLESYLQDFQDAIDSVSKQANNKYLTQLEKQQKEKSLNKLKAKHEKLLRDIEIAKGNTPSTPLANPDDFNQPTLSPDNLVSNDSVLLTLLSQIYDNISDNENPYHNDSTEITITLIGLLSGLTEKQLKAYLNTDTATVRYYIQALKESVTEIAAELDFENDSSLLQALNSLNKPKLENQKDSIRKEREYRELQAEITRPQVCRIMKNSLLNYIDAITAQQEKAEKSLILLRQCLAQSYTETFNQNPLTDESLEFDTFDEETGL